jgi:hypothetical protein
MEQVDQNDYQLQLLTNEIGLAFNDGTCIGQLSSHMNNLAD